MPAVVGHTLIGRRHVEPQESENEKKNPFFRRGAA